MTAHPPKSHAFLDLNASILIFFLSLKANSHVNRNITFTPSPVQKWDDGGTIAYMLNRSLVNVKYFNLI